MTHNVLLRTLLYLLPPHRCRSRSRRPVVTLAGTAALAAAMLAGAVPAHAVASQRLPRQCAPAASSAG